MGLKWFRARLSINKEETSKFPTMTGLYKRVSYFEYNTSTVPQSPLYTSSATSPTISNDSTVSANDEEARYDRAKADLAGPLSSSITDTEERDNRAAQNEELSTFTKDSSITKRSLMREEESNKLNKEQSHTSDMKSHICQENEIVI